MLDHTAFGVDGCKAGWFYFRLEGDSTRFGVAASIDELLADAPDHAKILIDVPIGLRESGEDRRACDEAARSVLRPKRHSSVFPAPLRQVLHAPDYASANALSREISGRGLSKQTWAITPKIREVDHVLQRCGRARGLIRETHPEVCFWGIAGAPMLHYKKTRAGLEERLRHLSALDSAAGRHIADAFLIHGGFDVARDDVVDAYVAALIGRASSALRTLPPEPELDPTGLPMEIVYADLSGSVSEASR